MNFGQLLESSTNQGKMRTEMDYTDQNRSICSLIDQQDKLTLDTLLGLRGIDQSYKKLIEKKANHQRKVEI